MLVPEGFVVPREMRNERFRLEPLGPQHNESDYAAWMSSIKHLQGTPGFADHGWPPDEGLPIEENLSDLVRHADEFDRRVAFAYTVLRPEVDEVIGCVYLDPADTAGAVKVRSWVRADVAELDGVLRAAVRDWLASAWPFEYVSYAQA
ncbi:hypothetical protein BH09ACT7_BH09ACT7_01690 [soil metagenome]